MNRNIINKINNEFNFNLPYDEFIKKVDLNKIKNKNNKKIIVTSFSLFITSLCIIIGFPFLSFLIFPFSSNKRLLLFDLKCVSLYH